MGEGGARGGNQKTVTFHVVMTESTPLLPAAHLEVAEPSLAAGKETPSHTDSVAPSLSSSVLSAAAAAGVGVGEGEGGPEVVTVASRGHVLEKEKEEGGEEEDDAAAGRKRARVDEEDAPASAAAVCRCLLGVVPSFVDAY